MTRVLDLSFQLYHFMPDRRLETAYDVSNSRSNII